MPRDELRRAVEARDPGVGLVPIQELNPAWSGGQSPVPAPEGGDCRRRLDTQTRFAVGQSVRTQTHGYCGHTRLPGYARGKIGVVHKINGGWVFPDSNAHGLGENPQHLYTVAFSGQELWGVNGDPNVSVFLDLFEPYLLES